MVHRPAERCRYWDGVSICRKAKLQRSAQRAGGFIPPVSALKLEQLLRSTVDRVMRFAPTGTTSAKSQIGPNAWRKRHHGNKSRGSLERVATTSYTFL